MVPFQHPAKPAVNSTMLWACPAKEITQVPSYKHCDSTPKAVGQVPQSNLAHQSCPGLSNFEAFRRPSRPANPAMAVRALGPWGLGHGTRGKEHSARNGRISSWQWWLGDSLNEAAAHAQDQPQLLFHVGLRRLPPDTVRRPSHGRFLFNARAKRQTPQGSEHGTCQRS